MNINISNGTAILLRDSESQIVDWCDGDGGTGGGGGGGCSLYSGSGLYIITQLSYLQFSVPVVIRY